MQNLCLFLLFFAFLGEEETEKQNEILIDSGQFEASALKMGALGDIKSNYKWNVKINGKFK